MNTVLDIETIPSDSEYALQEHADYCETKIAPPSNYKKQETIDKWMEENAPAMREKHRHSQGLDASTGEIITIGWKCHDDPVTAIGRGNHSEGDLIQNFLDSIDKRKGQSSVLFVGHNVIKFDLPYIWRRAKILGVQVPAYLPPPADLKPWSTNVCDTMIAWAGAQGSISLDRLGRVLGFDGKGGMTGADVWQYYKDGRQAEIDAYCMEDCSLTYQIANRLM